MSKNDQSNATDKAMQTAPKAEWEKVDASVMTLVNYARPSTMEHDGVKLIPGPNKVSLRWWAKAISTHKIIQTLVDEGTLSEIETGRGDTSVALKDLPPAAAKSMILETTNKELLEQWKDSENSGKKRKAVIDAIDGQLAELNKGPQFRNGDPSKNA